MQFAVHQGPAGGGVGGEDSDLAVLRPSGGARILPLHPGRGGALLQEACVVDDQHTVRSAEPLGYGALEVVADLVRTPLAP